MCSMLTHVSGANFCYIANLFNLTLNKYLSFVWDAFYTIMHAAPKLRLVSVMLV